MLQPVDVQRNVLSIQSSIVVHHHIVIFKLTGETIAEELGTLLICPVRVGIVSKEVALQLSIELCNVLLSPSELHHTIVILLQTMGMLVEKGSILHVLIVNLGVCLHVSGEDTTHSCRGQGNCILHFRFIINYIL